MRKFSFVLVAGMLLFAGSVLANDGKTKEPKKDLTSQIGDLLQSNRFVLNEDQDLTAVVKFTLNDEGQIVVLNVTTDVAVLEAFVKAKLNYQKVDVAQYREGKMYSVPVRIQA